MCGRYTLTTDPQALAERFQVSLEGLELRPRYNVAPSQPVLAVVWEGGRRRARLLRWGLVPHWARDLLPRARTVNARAETVDRRPAFRDAFRQRRCLVLADGFYEWSRRDGRRRPYRVVLRSGEPFGMAGLWDVWRSPDGEAVATCAVVTTEANETVASIHHRMPVILPQEAEGRWLDPRTDASTLRGLMVPYPAEAMRAYPVSGRVNSVENDDPDCLRPIEAEGRLWSW